MLPYFEVHTSIFLLISLWALCIFCGMLGNPFDWATCGRQSEKHELWQKLLGLHSIDFLQTWQIRLCQSIYKEVKFQENQSINDQFGGQINM